MDPPPSQDDPPPSQDDPFDLLDHAAWCAAPSSKRISCLNTLALHLTHMEEDDDLVSRSWRILHRSLHDQEPTFRFAGLHAIKRSVVSWRDHYFHHNPNAIDRLILALTGLALGDSSHRTRLAAIDAIGRTQRVSLRTLRRRHQAHAWGAPAECAEVDGIARLRVRRALPALLATAPGEGQHERDHGGQHGNHVLSGSPARIKV